MSDKIQLKKGEKINLAKQPNLKRVRIGLGWGKGADLDVSAFVCQHIPSGDAVQPKLISNSHFVFYNNKATPCKGVIHTGDNRTGDGDGDDETIIIDLEKLTKQADEISFVVTFDGDSPIRTFGKVRDAYVNIYDDVTNKLLAEFKLTETYSTEVSMQVGSLTKTDDKWEFVAVGNAQMDVDLVDYVVGYGGDV